MSQKFCVDCQHHRVTRWLKRHVCEHPAHFTGPADPVTGLKNKRTAVSARICGDLRVSHYTGGDDFGSDVLLLHPFCTGDKWEAK